MIHVAVFAGRLMTVFIDYCVVCMRKAARPDLGKLAVTAGTNALFLLFQLSVKIITSGTHHHLVVESKRTAV